MYFKMIEEEECPICLAKMDEEEGILIMDCCSKKVHLACIVTWYTEQRTQQTCFLCNQPNKFSQSILATSPPRTPPTSPPRTPPTSPPRTPPTSPPRTPPTSPPRTPPSSANTLIFLETSLVHNNPNLEFQRKFPCLVKHGQQILVFGSVISFLGIACILTICFTVIK